MLYGSEPLHRREREREGERGREREREGDSIVEEIRERGAENTIGKKIKYIFNLADVIRLCVCQEQRIS